MPIRARSGEFADLKRYLNPVQLAYLMQHVLPMGTIMTRKQFFHEQAPRYDAGKVKVSIGNRVFSIRPAWTDYYQSPETHLIVIGHVLFCHVNDGYNWYYQPSTRLFSENPTRIERQFKELRAKAEMRNGVIPTVNDKIFA